MFKENIVDLICDISTTFPLSEEFKSNLSWFIINLACDDYCPVNFKDVDFLIKTIFSFVLYFFKKGGGIFKYHLLFIDK